MKKVIITIRKQKFDILVRDIFKNYPHDEWGLFATTSWSMEGETLAINLIDFIHPEENEVTIGKGVVHFNEPYLVKGLKTIMRERSGMAVIHSHPERIRPFPSLIDDDMDGYLNEYFGSFSSKSPYLSLIFRKTSEGLVQFTGRGVYNQNEFVVTELRVVGKEIERILSLGVASEEIPDEIRERLKRLSESYGAEVPAKLWSSEVTIVGCGGTGSPSAHSLARSGVGTINLVDFDVLNLHNSERVHGAFDKHFRNSGISKVQALKELIQLINPRIKVNIHQGSVLDPEAKEMILRSHVVLSCTDSEHAKVALSEYVWRYNSVVLQVNVSLESDISSVLAQVIHVTHLFPGGPCLYCMDMVNSQRLSQELMSAEESNLRQEAEKGAGEGVGAYWVSSPSVPTVGALATIGGEKISNFAIGLLSGKFLPVAHFSEEDLLSDQAGIHLNFKCRADCVCQGGARGDQAGEKAILLPARF